MENNEGNSTVDPPGAPVLPNNSLKVNLKGDLSKNGRLEKIEPKMAKYIKSAGKKEIFKKGKPTNLSESGRTSRKGGRSRYYIYPNTGSIGVNAELNNPELNTWGFIGQTKNKQPRRHSSRDAQPMISQSINNWGDSTISEGRKYGKRHSKHGGNKGKAHAIFANI